MGILRQAYEREGTDAEVVRVFEAALADLRHAGATVVEVGKLDLPQRATGGNACMGFQYDFDRFLATLGDGVPVKSLAEVVKSRKFHPSVQVRLEQALKNAGKGPESPECAAEMAYRQSFREAVSQAMEASKLDGFVYPTWSNPPRLIGDLNTPGGDNSQVFSPTSGFPAITVPMGYTRGTLPAGITFFGRAWSEAVLVRLAYAYEQATHWRRMPSSTPPLRD